MLIDALRTGDRSVGDLAETIGPAFPNASRHLAVLRGAGLVDSRRIGTTVLYQLSEPGIVAACDVIHAIVDRRLARRAPDRAGSTASTAPQAIQR